MKKSVVRKKKCYKNWVKLFSFLGILNKNVCDEFYHDGTKKCDYRLFHAKGLHEIFSCLTIFVMQIVV